MKKIELPELPYDTAALEPYVSARTLEFHHGKHHHAYVTKLNDAIAGTDYADLSLEEIVHKASTAGDVGVFQNAGQTWNHTFLWNSMSPEGGGSPDGDLREKVEEQFGSVEEFRTQFSKAAMGQFGSGWAWLVRQPSGNLAIVATANADTPIITEDRPLLTLDVWEHAYYLDYQNARQAYVDTFLDNLVNWKFAAENYRAA